MSRLRSRKTKSRTKAPARKTREALHMFEADHDADAFERRLKKIADGQSRAKR